MISGGERHQEAGLAAAVRMIRLRPSAMCVLRELKTREGSVLSGQRGT
jgi:hypothetical protein